MALVRRVSLLGVLALAVTAVVAARDTDARSGSRDTHTRTGLLFNGANKSVWQDQSATSTRVRRVWDPSGGPGMALKFTAYNTDVFPLTPTGNPRAQLVTYLPVRPGAQFWESFEVYLPPNFPVAETDKGWLSLGSPAFGQPWKGTPPVSLSIANGDFQFQRNGYATVPWQVAWQTPVVLGQWIRFTWHLRLSQNGFVQLWMNNQPAELVDGVKSSTTLNLPVLDPTNDRGPWISQLSVYFKHNSFRQVTVYFRDFRIATTEALAVAG